MLNSMAGEIQAISRVDEARSPQAYSALDFVKQSLTDGQDGAFRVSVSPRGSSALSSVWDATGDRFATGFLTKSEGGLADVLSNRGAYGQGDLLKISYEMSKARDHAKFVSDLFTGVSQALSKLVFNS